MKPSAFPKDLRHLLGEAAVIDDPDGMAPYLREWRGFYEGKALLVARPACRDEVREVVRLCRHHKIEIVPQGGNTGLAGGATPRDSSRQILLSLERLNRIRDLEAQNNTLTAEAGCILSDIHDAATRAGRLFPLRMASQNCCHIGGNIATNAGGINALRYGSMRDLVLGIEAVLPNGQIFHGLQRVRKDNTGYDLKHLLIGSEGTLGIITAAVLKLFPLPRGQTTVMAALASPSAVLDFFHHVSLTCADALSAFELLPRIGLDWVLRHIPSACAPFVNPSYPWFVLLDLSIHDRLEAENRLKSLVKAIIKAEGLLDTVVATDPARAKALWHLRESLPAAQTHEGGSIKHDISLPISAIPAFLEEATYEVETMIAGARLIAFGHIGDGNIHFNISQPEGSDKQSFLAHKAALNRLIHDLTRAHGGSISAEHGIGLLKRDELRRLGDPVSLSLMQDIKQVMDPDQLMNPGKIL